MTNLVFILMDLFIILSESMHPLFEKHIVTFLRYFPNTANGPIISRWLGYSCDMWNAFIPQLSEIEKEFYGKIIGNKMLWSKESGEVQIYEGVPSCQPLER